MSNETKVILERPDGKKKFALRMEHSEHLFWTMKRVFIKVICFPRVMII